MEGVIVDFASLFEYGSGYTALSRVKELNKIKLLTYPLMEMEADLNNIFVFQPQQSQKDQKNTNWNFLCFQKC